MPPKKGKAGSKKKKAKESASILFWKEKTGRKADDDQLYSLDLLTKGITSEQ